MDSSGNQSAAEPNPAGQAASQPAGPGTAEPEHTPLPNVATWQLYTDPVVPFSIRYPRSNVRLAEPATFDQEAPGLVQRVRFQDAQVARRDTAQLEPPQCTIEVFANPQSLGLEQWLDQSLPQGASREGAVVGNRQGYRVALHIMLAPNTFYYVADGAYIIRLTPLGTDAMQMVDSFTVGA